MMIAANDEDKRSRLWKRTTVVSSVLIVVIAVYLLAKMFTTNPLEGTWESEDRAVTLDIGAKGVLTVNAGETSEDGGVEIRMEYAIDKDEKTISIRAEDGELEKLSKESGGGYAKEEVPGAVDALTTEFNYSVDHSQLTLTEREYGEQLIFTRK